MENKVEVYKDSKGKLHENRNEYYSAELKIMHEANIENWEHWLEMVKDDPENFYKIMMNFIKIIESKTPEENQKSFQEKIDFIKEAKRIENENEAESGEPFSGESNWNASPGDWLGIYAQDLQIPNC